MSALGDRIRELADGVETIHPTFTAILLRDLAAVADDLWEEAYAKGFDDGAGE